jgi:hypothetical protein
MNWQTECRLNLLEGNLLIFKQLPVSVRRSICDRDKERFFLVVKASSCVYVCVRASVRACMCVCARARVCV